MPYLNGLSLRLAGAEDGDFLLNLFHRSRAAELTIFGFNAQQEQQFIQMQFRARAMHYAQAYPTSKDHIVQLHGEAIGRLLLHKSASLITLVDIALLPEQCGKGFGAQLLNTLAKQADLEGSVIELHVEQHSRAKKLYEQLGFVQTHSTPPYDAMIRKPAAQVA